MYLLVQLLFQRSVKVNPAYLGIRPPENWSQFKVKLFCEMFGHSERLKNTTLIRIWVQTDPAAEGSGVDRHCPYNPWKCYHSRIWKQSLVGYFRNTILKLRQIQKQEDHLPVDSAESVHSRTAESSSFTVITNTDLLATWIKFDPFWFNISN